MNNRLKLNIQYFDSGGDAYAHFYVFGTLFDTVSMTEEGSAYRYYWLDRDPNTPVTDDTFVGYRSRSTGLIYPATASGIGDMPSEGGWTSYDFDAVFDVNRLKINGSQPTEMKINGSVVQEAKINGTIVYGTHVY